VALLAQTQARAFTLNAAVDESPHSKDAYGDVLLAMFARDLDAGTLQAISSLGRIADCPAAGPGDTVAVWFGDWLSRSRPPR